MSDDRKARIHGATKCLLACMLLAACGPGLTSCRSGSGAAVRSQAAAGSHDAGPPPLDQFSGARAWVHLERLEKIGPRVSGTEGAARARAYIRDQLESMSGIDFRMRRAPLDERRADGPELMHITAEIPGESPDVLLLVAPLDTAHFESFEFVGTNESASASAMLIELARTLSISGPLPYTVWVTWLDGDHLARGEGHDDVPSLAGSRSFVRDLEQSEELSRIRLAVFFGAVGDADLEIARDLRSNALYREMFWDAADALGYGDAFPRDRGYSDARTGQGAFDAAKVRGVVSIADAYFGEAPGKDGLGSYWHSKKDTAERCAPESLEVVGRTTIEGLGRVSQRLLKIDQFARSPLTVGAELNFGGR